MVFDISVTCYIAILNKITRHLMNIHTDQLKFAFGKPIHLFPYHWLVNDDATLPKPPIRIEIHLL
jgi:hypothetical protein